MYFCNPKGPSGPSYTLCNLTPTLKEMSCVSGFSLSLSLSISIAAQSGVGSDYDDDDDGDDYRRTVVVHQRL